MSRPATTGAEVAANDDDLSPALKTLMMDGPQSPDPTVPSFVLALDGYEGPLDLLLVLARTQKVDLRKISILALVDQYLEFFAVAKQLRLEIAGDYLVMAAWLTYLKSRLLLPEPPTLDGEPTGEELAQRLAFQLRRLDAMRKVAVQLLARDRMDREVFARGAPEGVRVIRRSAYEADLYELLKAYGDQRLPKAETRYEVVRRPVFAIEAARSRLEAMLGKLPDWMRLEDFLPDAAPLEGEGRRTYLASSFLAALDLAKDGRAELRQEELFSPVYLRARHEAAQQEA